ncbi:MAG: hypothetical protein HZA91_00400 [Verrucomicrobia bacterium]|nr:hypothetical protein [Verrucomicrobiota bacterium]
MVRRIRDAQAEHCAGMSNADVIAFFKRAGDAAQQDARRRTKRHQLAGHRD